MPVNALLSFAALLLTQSAAGAIGEETRLQTCLDQAATDPAAALVTASQWLGQRQGETEGAGVSLAQQCLGVAATNLLRWEEAETAFIAARDARPVDQSEWRARLGTMAANAALASGRNAQALAHLQLAQADAALAQDAGLGASIANDRARALVALQRPEDAGAALADARLLAPADPQGWLLSATLARRLENLSEAQSFILEASRLSPGDPAVMLEAGLIAALGGDDDAARSNWQGLVEGAPDTPQAEIAREYLAQLATDPDG